MLEKAFVLRGWSNLEQVAWRVSILADIQNKTWHEQPYLADPAKSGAGLGEFQRCSEVNEGAPVSVTLHLPLFTLEKAHHDNLPKFSWE